MTKGELRAPSVESSIGDATIEKSSGEGQGVEAAPSTSSTPTVDDLVSIGQVTSVRRGRPNFTQVVPDFVSSGTGSSLVMGAFSSLVYRLPPT